MCEPVNIENVKICVEQNGWELIDLVLLPSVSDSYLAYVVSKKKNQGFMSKYEGAYQTHLYNATTGEFGGLFYGHYGFKTREEAIDRMYRRLENVS